MKAILKAGKFFIYLFSLCALVSFCAYYTHPNFVKEELSSFIPSLKSAKNFFRFQHKCKEFEAVSPKLSDKYADYIWNSAYQKFGEPLHYSNEIKYHHLEGKLEKVESNDFYIVDTLYYSYSFLTPKAKNLLDEIAISFQKKLENTTLRKAKLHVTSLLRTFHSVKRLRKRNRNSLRISSHLHGTTFDLDYDNFEIKDTLNSANIYYLKETLAETLEELRKEKKCFVTYEVRQSCFHVVCRKK